mmetsp:Transcript_18792/g.52365  ORF Transcript_18792/g.52365 Transcript_18792/m.52365 type:complete len:197 (+) Transcript_18792:495-1085(+)
MCQDYPEFVKASPRGLVPALDHNGGSVHESLVCVEYVDDAFLDGPALLPKEPLLRAKARVVAAHCNDRVIPHYYKMLMQESAEGQEEAKDNLLEGLRQLLPLIDPTGPFFVGGSFGLADISIAPWWERLLSVSKAYRGFEVPDTEEFARLHKWYAACLEVQAFKRTIVDQEKLVANYSGYANNSATSDAAKKFRAT